MSVSPPQRLLFWTPANMNVVDGSTSFVNKSVQFLATSLPNLEVHLLLKCNIDPSKSFPPTLKRLKSVKIIQPKDLKIGSIKEETQLEKLILTLNRKYRYRAIFIRSQSLLTHPTFFERIPNIHLFFWFCLFTRLTPQRVQYLYQKCKSIWASSPLIQNKFAKAVNTNISNRLTYFMPVAYPIKTKEQLPKIQSPLKLCYAGKFRKQYFIEEMVKAFTKIQKKMGKKVELHIYGDVFGPHVSSKHLKNLFKITTGIIYHGNVNNDKIDSELKKHHLGLSIRGPIHQTCLDISSKMINYAKLGMPCLCNRSLINADFYGPKYTGYTETVNEMEAQITKYLTSPKIYHQDQILSLQACRKYSFPDHQKRISQVLGLN